MSWRSVSCISKRRFSSDFGCDLSWWTRTSTALIPVLSRLSCETSCLSHAWGPIIPRELWAQRFGDTISLRTSGNLQVIFLWGGPGFSWMPHGWLPYEPTCSRMVVFTAILHGSAGEQVPSPPSQSLHVAASVCKHCPQRSVRVRCATACWSQLRGGINLPR